ncbi:hypothetical protein ACIRA6_15295 [Kitasatospora griseola]|uniref:hypothetical protein n=1 Tax=Kitasatospora griseola TaxID=2064 RepID=UPI0037F537C2
MRRDLPPIRPGDEAAIEFKLRVFCASVLVGIRGDPNSRAFYIRRRGEGGK